MMKYEIGWFADLFWYVKLQLWGQGNLSTADAI